MICVLGTPVHLAKVDELIRMPFGGTYMGTRVDARNLCWMEGSRSSMGRSTSEGRHVP